MENNRKNILVLISLAFLGSFGFGFIRIIVPIYTRNLGATGVQIGLLSSGFMLARAFAALVFGKRSDIRERRCLYIQAGLFSMTVVILLYPLVKNYYWILFIRVLQGFFSGITWPIAQTLLLESSKKERRTTYLSVYFIFGRVGGILANLILGILVYYLQKTLGIEEMNAFSYFFGLSAFFFFIAFLESITLGEISEREITQKKVEKEGKVKVNYIFFLALIVGLFLGTLNSILIIYLKEVFHLSTGNVAYAMFGASLISFPFVLYMSMLADRKGVEKIFHIIIVSTILLSVFIPALKDIRLLVILLGLIFAALNSFVPISRAAISHLSRGKSLGEGIGKINAFQNFGQIMGPIISGAVYDTFKNKLFSLTIFGIMLAIGYMMWLIDLKRKK